MVPDVFTASFPADGQQLAAAGVPRAALHAPGHTLGARMVRTDLPGGSAADMLDSLRTTVLPLPGTWAVLPGHGPQTTAARERAQDPHLQPARLSRAGRGTTTDEE